MPFLFDIEPHPRWRDWVPLKAKSVADVQGRLTVGRGAQPKFATGGRLNSRRDAADEEFCSFKAHGKVSSTTAAAVAAGVAVKRGNSVGRP